MSFPIVYGKVFVFGSNLAGIHRSGAAKDAIDHYGAIYGMGVGRQGLSYAIPTKDCSIRTLPLRTIEFYVRQFEEYALTHPREHFFVTPIGTGLAGYRVEDIAPMFQYMDETDNIELPQSFLDFYSREA